MFEGVTKIIFCFKARLDLHYITSRILLYALNISLKTACPSFIHSWILKGPNTISVYFSKQDPAARRRAALEESLRWHEFNFELDAEMQWIKEHMPLATSTVSSLAFLIII